MQRRGRLACLLTCLAWSLASNRPAALPAPLPQDGTLWTFAHAAAPLTSARGDATLSYFDPDGSGWGPRATRFGKASTFDLPPMGGGDPDVMEFPGGSARRGYRLQHGSPPNGSFARSDKVVSNYTLIADVLYPAESDGAWRPLYQTNLANENEAEFAIRAAAGGGIGTLGQYHGRIRPGTWHRIAIVVQAAPEEGKAQQFIDGRFVGGIGTTDAGLGVRWTLDPALLLFTDARGDAARGYVSSLYFVDRALSMEALHALGGPHAAGALTPGAPAPPFEGTLPANVEAIGHRGGFFCCAPDNTLAAVRRAIEHGVPVVEIDIRLSADGEAMVIHDATVDRTTNGSGPVAGVTAAELSQLDAGSWFGPEFSGERIPTLSSVMGEAKGRLTLYLDLKVNGQIDAVMKALRESGFKAADCWFWTYGDADEAARIRARLPDARIVGTDPPGDWRSRPDFFASQRAAGVHAFDLGMAYVDANPDFVRAAKANGFLLSVHTVLDPESMLRYGALGIDYIETDFPQIVQALKQ